MVYLNKTKMNIFIFTLLYKCKYDYDFNEYDFIYYLAKTTSKENIISSKIKLISPFISSRAFAEIRFLKFQEQLLLGAPLNNCFRVFT